MTISVVFDPPLRSDSPAVFNSKAFTLVGDLNNWSNQANALASDVTSKQTTASDAATTATNQANIATDKANIATNQAAAAAASYDSFDDRYLGAKDSDPTLDNDGNALIEGALYWNSTAKETRTWNGTAWVTTSVANAVSRGGDTMTGPLSVPAGASGAQVPRAQEVVSKTGDTMTGNLNVPSINGGQLAGMRNKVINGKMEIAQRGTSFAAIASGAYSLDRWYNGNSSGGVITISQQLDAPSSNEFQYSLRCEVTTADTTIAAGDFAFQSHRIEGFNARDLIGRTFTVSFWVRSSKTGAHCIALRNAGDDRSYIAEYTVNAANTWEKKSVTIAGGLITAGTQNFTNGKGLEVSFILAAGTTYQTTAGAWQTGNFLATANQVNVLDTVGNIFAITGFQLEVGEVATPFEHRPYGTELTLCQRYYEVTQKVVANLTSPALETNDFRWKVSKRAAATLVVTFDTGSGATFQNLNPGVNGAYQSAAHSSVATATIVGNCEI